MSNPSYADINAEGVKAHYDINTLTGRKLTGSYDYVPCHGDVTSNQYDYDSPFWKPSDQEVELLEQFETLRIQSVSNEELK